MTTANPSKETVATSTKEVLVAARWILDNVGWCQGHSMVDAAGNPLDTYQGADMKKAVALCSAGAVNVVNVGVKWNLISDAIYALSVAGSPQGQHTSIVQWNDAPGRTKKEVLDLFDSAIAKCK